MAEPCGAEILVRNPKAQGVTHVFGVPGAKVDRVCDSLLDLGIETVVCRHEQNASFIAQGEVPVDYSHNCELGQQVGADEIV